MFPSLHTKLTHFRSYVPFSPHKAYSLQIIRPLLYTQSLLQIICPLFLHTKLTHFRSYVLFSTHKAYSLHMLCPLLSTQELLQFICSLLYTQSLLTSDPKSTSLHTKLTSHPTSHSLYTKLTHFRSYVPFPPHKADSLQILCRLLSKKKALLTSDPPSQS